MVLLSILASVSCNGAQGTTVPALAPSPCDETPLATATKAPQASLTSPECYGLFVDMKDKSGGKFTGVVERQRGGIPLLQRAYIYAVGDPITVTAAVVVFGEGELVLGMCNILRDYTITLVDREGQDVAVTDEWTRARNAITPCIGGIVVDRNTPYVESFSIEQWFDLSSTGMYTLTMSREVVVSGSPQEIRGNPVILIIRP